MRSVKYRIACIAIASAFFFQLQAVVIKKQPGILPGLRTLVNRPDPKENPL